MIVAEFYIGSGISPARFQVFLPSLLIRFPWSLWSRIQGHRSTYYKCANLMDQGSVRCGSKYFYHRYLSGFLDRSDPRSKGIDRLITSEPTLDPGSVLPFRLLHRHLLMCQHYWSQIQQGHWSVSTTGWCWIRDQSSPQFPYWYYRRYTQSYTDPRSLAPLVRLSGTYQGSGISSGGASLKCE